MFDPIASRAAAAIAALAMTPVAVLAQAAPDTAPQRSYAIAAGALGPVLHQIVAGSGLALAIPADIVQGRRSPGVRGHHTPRAALGLALQGSGLQVQVTPSGALTLGPAPANAQPQPPAPPAGQHLSTVVVTSDAPAATTQGSGAYTVPYISLGKGLATLRETPNSVSVVTRQQLDEQNAVSLGDAMAYVTGIRIFNTSTGVVNLRSRGFRLNNYLIDGMPLRGGQGMWGSALMDVSLYDRVEVWRGPAGLLEGAGEPSGTINLARKRAAGAPSTQVTAMLGSWDKRRAELDINRPLNEDGSLRGRLVALHDERGSFIDHVEQRTPTLYGTLEYDVSPATTLALGRTQQQGQSVAFAGLPLIAGGAAPDYARSTFLGSRNGLKHDKGHGSFIELTHRTDAGGTWRTHLNEQTTRNTLDRFISNSLVNPSTRQFDLEGAWQKSLQINQGFDTYYTQPFDWGGRRHEFTVGANHQVFKGGQIQQRHAIWRQNVDAPQHDLALPARDLGAVPRLRTRDRGLYGNVRLRPAHNLMVLAGARLAWWDSHDPTRPADDQAIDRRFVPNAGVVYDIHPQWSLYASYNRIFAPQTERFASGGYLSPRTGEQVEAGIKGELLDQRVNMHFALFRIDDKGRAVDDPAQPNYSLAAGHVRSQGVEAEVSGRITPAWNLTAGYAFTRTEHLDGLLNQRGLSFDSTFPRHQFSLWTRYQLPAHWLPGAYVGAGVRSNSGTFADYGGVRWSQGGYTVVTLQAGYSWKPGWSATLTVNNLFDKVYFERFAGGNARQTFYGEPANVTLTVRASF